MAGKEILFFVYSGGRAEYPGARLMRWFLPIMLSLSCSLSSAQIEPKAGKWKTWVLTSGDQLRLPPPPDEAATRAAQQIKYKPALSNGHPVDFPAVVRIVFQIAY